MKTRITELFGIKHPIVLAGMNWVTQPEMVAAVCNAGGLGILDTARCTPEILRKEIRQVRTLTDKPFAINQMLTAPKSRANIEAALEEDLRIAPVSRAIVSMNLSP